MARSYAYLGYDTAQHRTGQHYLSGEITYSTTYSIKKYFMFSVVSNVHVKSRHGSVIASYSGHMCFYTADPMQKPLRYDIQYLSDNVFSFVI